MPIHKHLGIPKDKQNNGIAFSIPDNFNTIKLQSFKKVQEAKNTLYMLGWSLLIATWCRFNALCS